MASEIVFVWQKEGGCTGGGLHQPFGSGAKLYRARRNGATVLLRGRNAIHVDRPLAANEAMPMPEHWFAGRARSYARG